MTDTSGFSDYIAPQGPGQERILMTPNQIATKRKIGVPAGTTYVRPDADPGSTKAFAPDLVTVDTTGTLRTGPYEDPGLESAYRERLTKQDDAALEKQAQEVLDAAGEEEAAEVAAKADPNAKPEWKSLPERMTGLTGISAVGADVVQSIPELPTALVVGPKKAVNAMAELVKPIDDWARTTPLYAFQDMTDRMFQKAFADDKDGIVKTLSSWILKAPEAATGQVFDVARSEASIKTQTGNIVKNVSQFLVGFFGAGKFTEGWKVAGAGSKIAKGAVEGAIAQFTAFDGQEKNLSNLIQTMPELQNPVTEFLAVDEETPELVGRLKSTLEGALTGVAADGVIAGLRVMRRTRALKAAESNRAAESGTTDLSLPPEELAAKSAKIEADVEKLLKPKPKPSMAKKAKAQAGVVPKDAKALADDLTNGQQVPNTFDLPMHRMNTIEDVQAVILKMTNANAKNIDNARRGIQTWADTTKKAEAIDAITSMALRRRGDAINAETVVAYQQALTGANEKLLELAQAVKDAPEDVAKQIALRRATAVTHAINLEFMGARAEAGRALNAFKVAPESGAYRGLDLEKMLREAGGAEGAAELADKILRTAKNKGAAFQMASGWEHFGAALKMTYTNGLLSGPATSIVNMLGNSAALMQDLAVRMALRTEVGVTEHEAGEAAAVLSGYFEAMKDVFRMNPKQAFGEMSWDRFKEQGAIRGLAPGLDSAMPPGLARGGREEAGRAGGVIAPSDPKLARPLSASAFNVEEASGFGRFLDAVQMFIESPGNTNALGDDFFATLAARGELRAQAFRQATKEARAAGGWTKDQMWTRQVELLEKPTPEMLAAAEKQMKELTFTRSDGGFEQWLQKGRRMADHYPGLPAGTMLMPFVRTPANLMSYAIRNSPMAPLSARWQKAMAAGGAEREVALTQFALGTAAYAVFMEATANGDITGSGPKNKAQRDALMRKDPDGNAIWQPYSVRVGGRWIAYDRLDPVGQNMSLAADLAELIANSDWDESQQEDLSEASAHVIGAIGTALFDKTILEGTFNTVAAVTSGDTTTIEREMGNRLTGLVPFSASARTIRRGQDPYMREVSGMLDSLKNSMPGMSDDLPPSRDLWGKPRTYQTGIGVVYDAMQPIKTSAAGGSAIDYEILDNGVSIQIPQRSFTIDGQNVSLKNNLDIYSEFVRLAGEPAFEQLEAVVTGDHPDSAYYFSLSDGPTGGKAAYIKGVVEDYRKAAKEMILEQYGDRLNKLAADRVKRIEGSRTGTTPVR